ncbi:type II toxin-antitoxin system PemK/MazF family toxin [Butyrivibrio sp. WCD3002]|uniref:type II toxin-antitoxin system PemK/MazF family toxin n=2 Tax=unclassified Butyrivibrio TaxID=2639466 RepID=UPI0009DC0F7B|nr:type II toxin-antitoxin system PemK/MazF family toxin [Butyrivibrio sp. WCD3002]
MGMNEIQRGEIYLADLGEGVGSEQKGIRPVLIVQNNRGNKYSPTVTVLPITTKIHKSSGLPTHVILDGVGGLKEKSATIAEQIMTIDKTRLIEYMGILDEKFMRRYIDNSILVQLNIDNKKRGKKDGKSRKVRNKTMRKTDVDCRRSGSSLQYR